MWTRDNLDVLRGLNSASIDLVYADPPFNSNKNYAAPVGSKAAGAAFKDSWTLSDVDGQPGCHVGEDHASAYVDPGPRLGVPAVVPQSDLDAGRQRHPAAEDEVPRALQRGPESGHRRLGGGQAPGRPVDALGAGADSQRRP